MSEKKYYPLNCAMFDGSCIKLTEEYLCQFSEDSPKERCFGKIINIKTADKGTQSTCIASKDIDKSIVSFAKLSCEENCAVNRNKNGDSQSAQVISESRGIESKSIDQILEMLFEGKARGYLHSKRVGEICKEIALEMNFTKADVHQIRLAGLMHDIGKIAISEDILEKSDRLSCEEYEIIKKHSEIGYKILCSTNRFAKIADCVLEHHERWDGKGYPKGISGEEILLHARIVAVADAFDAMTSERPYRETVSREEAIAEIKAKAGTQFDPAVVEVFAGIAFNDDIRLAVKL